MRRPSPLKLVGLVWLVAIIGVLVGRAYAQDVPAWAKAYHTCGTPGATADDCDPPKRGNLYAFCDSEQTADICDQHVLVLKDVCEETVWEWTDGSDRFSCAVVDDATRDAYLDTLEPDVRENTFRAWREGR